jgi:uncharacterized protein DUF6647
MRRAVICVAAAFAAVGIGVGLNFATNQSATESSVSKATTGAISFWGIHNQAHLEFLSVQQIFAMETWVSNQFDLPVMHEHPRIEFAPPAKIASLRFTGLLSDPKAQVEPDNRASSAQYDTIAIYDDATRTIYLPEGWTGKTAAELSVLVHELVHHFQNVLGLKHECPQEREKLAYIAQDRWLGLFGHSLADDFALDPFSLFVKTACFY